MRSGPTDRPGLFIYASATITHLHSPDVVVVVIIESEGEYELWCVMQVTMPKEGGKSGWGS